jgi:hypothetical protein
MSKMEVAAIAARIQRVGHLIQKTVSEEVKNNLLHDELLMRAYEIQQLGSMLTSTVGDKNERL